MPPGIPPQIPTVMEAPRKRKRMVDIDDIAADFNVIPKDYEAAWKKIRTHIEEISTPGRLSTVGLCCI
jgi:hypothetical protein